MKETIIKVKAHMDILKDNFGSYLYDPILEAIPFKYEDDVFEFEIVVRNVKDITEEIGKDNEGGRAFQEVKVFIVEKKEFFNITEKGKQALKDLGFKEESVVGKKE